MANRAARPLTQSPFPGILPLLAAALAAVGRLPEVLGVYGATIGGTGASVGERVVPSGIGSSFVEHLATFALGAAYAALLVALRPSDDALSSAGQLSELLVMLGHERDAAALQAALAELAASSSAAGEFVVANPPKIVESEAEQRRNAKKDKEKRGVAPQWKWDVLRPMTAANETSALDSDEDDFGAFSGLGHGFKKRGGEAVEEEKDDGLFS